MFFMRIKFAHNFEKIIGLENLLEAWKKFAKGKRGKRDVQEFSFRLMDNIFMFHHDLSNRSYKHGGYQAFNICDPKPRNIHKAAVRDRLLHHAIYRTLYPFFDKVFIADSYSCRINKGTHKAINRFRKFAYKVSGNNTQTCWVLKCDVKRFFENIDHKILLGILQKYIEDKNVLWLLENVIESFSAKRHSVGLPLGNLTSQLFVNIYMNEFDQFIKHKIEARYYLRYADDFVLLSKDRKWLQEQIEPIRRFLRENLALELHPDKIFIKTLASGVDFLGWVHFSDHRILRTRTKQRMIKRVRKNPTSETMQSYLGLLRHGNTDKIRSGVLREYLLSQKP